MTAQKNYSGKNTKNDIVIYTAETFAEVQVWKREKENLILYFLTFNQDKKNMLIKLNINQNRNCSKKIRKRLIY